MNAKFPTESLVMLCVAVWYGYEGHVAAGILLACVAGRWIREWQSDRVHNERRTKKARS